jgi:hypothetical protein
MYIKSIVYKALLPTIISEFGTFAAFLATPENSLSGLVKAIADGQTAGTIFDSQAFSDKFYSNLGSSLGAAIGGLIVNEVGEALDLDGVAGDIFNIAGRDCYNRHCDAGIRIYL